MSPLSPLRVLHVYAGNLYGGIETFLRTLAEERSLCPEMEPEFALCYEGRIAREIRASGATLHMLGGVRLSRPWTVIRAQRKFAAVLHDRRPDVVICHAAWPHAIFASVVRRAKIRLVFYRHDIGDKWSVPNLLARRVEPNVVVSNSQYSTNHGHPAFQTKNEKVVRYVLRAKQIANEPAVRDAVRAELGVSKDDVVILQASRMQAWKGQSLLIEALARLPTGIPWRCWFAGDAQRDSERAYADALRKAASNHGISDRIRFLGQRSDVPDLMIAADIFCQPNIAPEPFGIVFVEALAAGLPVLTTTLAGGALETLTEDCARTALPRSGELAEVLRVVLTDRTLRSQLSAHARARGKEFTQPTTRLRQLADVIGEPDQKKDCRLFSEVVT